ncbi:MAG: hypothetical protein PQJ46_04570 [Spirochaetales bacterium]|nr:hypothetical protein [Spirochaetales bacterium]
MIIKIINGAPWYAWIGLAYGIYVGVKNLEERYIDKKKLFIIGAVFLYLGLSTMLKTAQEHDLVILLWALMFSIGITLGWFFLTEKTIEYNQQLCKMKVKGSALFITLFPFIYVMKFIYGITSATSPATLHSVNFMIPYFSVSGIISGIMIGRILHLVYESGQMEKEV